MKAIYIRQHGDVGDLQASEVPEPSIGPGEVLVRIAASGINPSDVASVRGRFPAAVLPRIVGRDFAGKVVQGPAPLVGADVWGSGGDLGISRDGAHAQFIALPERAVARMPRKLSPEQAATVGVPYVTAFSALVRLGQLREGEWVIVSGAAGAVGQAAIQLAHARGGHVIALVKDASQRWIGQSPGVQALAESDAGDLDTVVRQVTGGKGADLALNGVGAAIFSSLVTALRVGGRQVVYSAAGGREVSLDLMNLYRNELSLFGLDTQKLDAARCAAILNELSPLFESGVLEPPPIAARYGLSDAAAAYARVASGGSGKVVLIAD